MSFNIKATASLAALTIVLGAMSAAGIVNAARLEDEARAAASQETVATARLVAASHGLLDEYLSVLERASTLNTAPQLASAAAQRTSLTLTSMSDKPLSLELSAASLFAWHPITVAHINAASARASEITQTEADANAAVTAADAVGVNADGVRAALPAFAASRPTTTEALHFDLAHLQAATTDLRAATQAEADRRASEEARLKESQQRGGTRNNSAAQPAQRGSSGGGAGGHVALEAIIRGYVSNEILWDASNGGGHAVGGVIHLDPSLTDNAWGRYVATHEAGHLVVDQCLTTNKPGATGNYSQRMWLHQLAVQHGVTALTIREWAADSFAANHGFGQRSYGGPQLDLGAMGC